ncbi:hypothetical protein [Desulfobacula toluolica]|nr:hypothetical protein [Desulfobacula toluolica]
MNCGTDDSTININEDMTFSVIDLFTGIIPFEPPASVVFTD